MIFGMLSINKEEYLSAFINLHRGLYATISGSREHCEEIFQQLEYLVELLNIQEIVIDEETFYGIEEIDTLIKDSESYSLIKTRYENIMSILKSNKIG